MFDIGASVGDYSTMVSEKYPKSTIYSFVTSKSTFELLADNVMQNKGI